MCKKPSPINRASRDVEIPPRLSRVTEYLDDAPGFIACNELNTIHPLHEAMHQVAKGRFGNKWIMGRVTPGLLQEMERKIHDVARADVLFGAKNAALQTSRDATVRRAFQSMRPLWKFDHVMDTGQHTLAQSRPRIASRDDTRQ